MFPIQPRLATGDGINLELKKKKNFYPGVEGKGNNFSVTSKFSRSPFVAELFQSPKRDIQKNKDGMHGKKRK